MRGRVLTHGYGGYGRGCRCEVCRTAKREYSRARRAEAVALARWAAHESGGGRLVVDGITHGRFGYEERGCRCEVCTHAKTSDRQATLARRLERARPG